VSAASDRGDRAPPREAASPPARLWPRRLVPCALVVLVFAAFSPALGAGFVDWDDDHAFLENPAYRGLTPGHLAWMATTRHMGHYQPLSWLTLGIDHALWGMDGRGYHLTNLLLHALTAVAFYLLARALLPLCLRSVALARPEIELSAALAALLFAVHPLRCESVAWITERRDVLSGLFLVLTLWTYVRHAGSEKRWLALALVLYSLSLLSKASGIVLPFVLLVLDRWPLARAGREPSARLLLEKLPFLGLAVLFGGLALWAAGYEDTTRTLAQHGTLERIVQAGYGLAFYVGRTLWPAHLVPIHELPSPFDPLEARWLVPALLAGLGTLVLFLLRARVPAAWTAWLCFGIVLAPVSGLAQSGPQLVADRYSYLACMPFALLAAGGLLAWARRRPARSLPAVQLGAGVVLLLGLATWRQTRVWHDSDTLWSRAVDEDPLNPTALQNLGVQRMRAGTESPRREVRARLWLQALALFERGFELSPRPEFLVNQGLIHMLLSDLDPDHAPERLERARELVERGIALQGERPGGVSPRWKLQHGILLLRLGRKDEAAARLAEVVQERPGDVEGRRMLGIALIELGRPEDARAHFEHALGLAPDDAQLWLRLGSVQKQLGRIPEARSGFERVLALRERALGPAARSDPDFLRARSELDQLPVAR
jgi:tetratricopeptide (TPR) repeat protein